MRYWSERICRTSPIPRWLAHTIDALILSLFAFIIVYGVVNGAEGHGRDMRFTARHGWGWGGSHGNGMHHRVARYFVFDGKMGKAQRQLSSVVASKLRYALPGHWAVDVREPSYGRAPVWLHQAHQALRLTRPSALAENTFRVSSTGVAGAPGSAHGSAYGYVFGAILVIVLFSLYLMGIFGVLRKCGYAGWYGLLPFTGPLALCEAGGNVWFWVLGKRLAGPPLSTVADVMIFYGLSVSFVGKRDTSESRGLSASPSPSSIWDDFSWRAFWLTIGFLFVPFFAFPLTALNEGIQYDARYRARLAERAGVVSAGAEEYEPIA